jgi:hypothetical protein
MQCNHIYIKKQITILNKTAFNTITSKDNSCKFYVFVNYLYLNTD